MKCERNVRELWEELWENCSFSSVREKRRWWFGGVYYKKHYERGLYLIENGCIIEEIRLPNVFITDTTSKKKLKHANTRYHVRPSFYLLEIWTFLADACLCNNFEQCETAVDKRLNRKYKNTFKWINLRRFKHKPVSNCSEGRKIFFCLHERFTSRLYSTSAESTLVKPSNWLLYKRWFDGCTSAESTVILIIF